MLRWSGFHRNHWSSLVYCNSAQERPHWASLEFSSRSIIRCTFRNGLLQVCILNAATEWNIEKMDFHKIYCDSDFMRHWLALHNGSLSYRYLKYCSGGWEIHEAKEGKTVKHDSTGPTQNIHTNLRTIRGKVFIYESWPLDKTDPAAEMCQWCQAHGCPVFDDTIGGKWT